MVIFLSLIVGLALWVVLWGTSLMKSFDAFLLGMFIVLLAATWHIVAAYLPGSRG
jgi:hypothetical protein